MRFPRLLHRYRWPLGVAVALGVASFGGALVGDHTVAGMDTFYANAAAADAERLARIESPPETDDTLVVDNTMPPVAPVDLSFARATNTAAGEESGDAGQ